MASSTACRSGCSFISVDYIVSSQPWHGKDGRVEEIHAEDNPVLIFMTGVTYWNHILAKFLLTVIHRLEIHEGGELVLSPARQVSIFGSI